MIVYTYDDCNRSVTSRGTIKRLRVQLGSITQFATTSRRVNDGDTNVHLIYHMSNVTKTVRHVTKVINRTTIGEGVILVTSSSLSNTRNMRDRTHVNCSTSTQLRARKKGEMARLLTSIFRGTTSLGSVFVGVGV